MEVLSATNSPALLYYLNKFFCFQLQIYLSTAPCLSIQHQKNQQTVSNLPITLVQLVAFSIFIFYCRQVRFNPFLM